MTSYICYQSLTSLQLLHPIRNTISYLAVLTAHKEHYLKTRQSQPSPELTNGTLTFLNAFDPVQARYVGRELRGLISWVAYYYEQTRSVRHLANARFT